MAKTEKKSETNDLVKRVQSLSKEVNGTIAAIHEYNTTEHKVFKEIYRPKKQVLRPTGKKDDKGNDITETKIEEVVRIGLPMQQLIVKRRAAFMNVGKMTLKATPKDDKEQKLLNMVNKCREDNKMAFKSTEIAKRMMSELQVAQLWFSEEVESSYWADDAPNSRFRMRMKILSPVLGDKLLPVFDNNGNLIYFGRQFKTTDPETAKETDNLDIYTKDGFWHFEMDGGKVSDGVFTGYSYGKIPIIYYSQDKPEWHDVQPAIERLETAISNLGDTNDYNGSPILVATGKIKGFATKGERGKTFEIENGGDLKYVNWDNAPQSVKMEIDLLIDFIYTCTQTPNISFKEMQGLGRLSGVAFDRVFLDAHLAAQDKLSGTYGECIQREINFLKSACVAINSELKRAEQMSISPEFSLFRINDDSETADFWMKVNGGAKLVSQKTSIKRAGFVDDAEVEMKEIEVEKEKETKSP